MAHSRRLHELARSAYRDGELVLELYEFSPHPVHKASTYFYNMVHAHIGERMGGINLRIGSSAHMELYAGHVGYGVEPEYRAPRYASRALRLLSTLTHEVGLNPLWITCDPENTASRRSCELAGAEFIEIVDVPADCVIHHKGHFKKCRYRLSV